MENGVAESAFKRELLFSQDALRQKPMLKVDQLFSIGLLPIPLRYSSYRFVNVSQLHRLTGTIAAFLPF